MSNKLDSVIRDFVRIVCNCFENCCIANDFNIYQFVTLKKCIMKSIKKETDLFDN